MPAAGDTPEGEHYLPAPEIPEEPHHPGRFRWLWVTITVLVVTVAVGVAVLQLISASRMFDPSLQFPGREPASPAPSDG